MDKEDMRLMRVKLDMVKTLLQEVYQQTSSSQVGYSPGYSTGLRAEGFSAWIESALFSAGKAHELILKQISAKPEMSRNEPVSSTEDHSSLKILDTLIIDLGLSTRSRRCLGSINVSTVGNLIKKTESDLKRIKNFGKASLLEVRMKLNEFGLGLSEKR